MSTRGFFQLLFKQIFDIGGAPTAVFRHSEPPPDSVGISHSISGFTRPDKSHGLSSAVMNMNETASRMFPGDCRVIAMTKPLTSSRGARSATWGSPI